MCVTVTIKLFLIQIFLLLLSSCNSSLYYNLPHYIAFEATNLELIMFIVGDFLSSNFEKLQSNFDVSPQIFHDLAHCLWRCYCLIVGTILLWNTITISIYQEITNNIKKLMGLYTASLCQFEPPKLGKLI